MEKRFYTLMIICDGALPEFTVDEEELTSFEKSFEKNEDIIESCR